MLIAYLDEFGHIGPYISDSHTKFNTHPVFGYAGFVMPAENVREFGGYFEYIKENLLRFEIERDGAHPRRWEKKGASLFTTKNIEQYPELTRAFKRLMRKLDKLGGKVIFYGQVKPLGSAKETGESAADRSAHALRQTLRRLSWHAGRLDRDIMIVLDSVDDKPRLEAVSVMASFIYSNSKTDLRRVVEAPMQVESHLYATIQFADWLCALLGRAAHHQFVENSQFAWAPANFSSVITSASCSEESKILVPQNPTKSVHSKHLFSAQNWIERTKPNPSVRAAPMPGPRPIFQRLATNNPELAELRDKLSSG
ncbi:DUF3800 domain-containing protein [Paenarthrobacter sp. YAF11_1]|uniref:DUF3800 domain-containing protein n=1 Tax=Paenarthrobacter TaxID=1742992 RepID=UPI0021C0DE49|nr:DUF3800 domain-containing protein [Paenarthrobacter aurescens]MCT9870800.1 DUF3800 domain-containing protein [Paenarthrobacter aurescens]